MCDLLQKPDALIRQLAETGRRVREATEAADGGPGKRPSPQRVPADVMPTSNAAKHNSGSHEDKTSGSAKDCEGQRQQPGVIPVSLESDDDPEDQ